MHTCDLSDTDDIDRMCAEVLEQHEAVDILVNNAGKSIRRSVDRAYDRFHDYQRTMQLNYFAAVKLILNLLPTMRERGSGHIVNISTIGLQMNTPRFSRVRRVEGRARRVLALDRPRGHRRRGAHHHRVHAAGAHADDRADQDLRSLPDAQPKDAGHMIAEAIRKRPKRMATMLGTIGQLTYAVAPGAQDLVVNRAYHLIPEGDKSSPTTSPRPRSGHSSAPPAACTGRRRGDANCRYTPVTRASHRGNTRAPDRT